MKSCWAAVPQLMRLITQQGPQDKRSNVHFRAVICRICQHRLTFLGPEHRPNI